MIIKNSSESKKLSNNILSLAQVAAAAKSNNKAVINATIGMYNDKDNSFYTFKAVKEAMKEIDDYHAFSYSDTDGGKDFQDAIIKWVFKDYINEFKSHYFGVVATPGGSGAIATTFQNYLDNGDTVLLPNHMWETYITFLKERECTYQTYTITDNNGDFNINSLKEEIDKLALTQKRIMIVLNDPCHNPTGFCMDDEAYEAVIELLNSYKNNSFVLLMDVAYFDFYNSDGNIIRARYAKLSRLDEHVLINFAFSGSKTFGLYGLRIGASIMLSKNISEIDCFKNAITYTARSNWSSVSSLGIAIISKLVLTEKYNKMFTDEIKEVSYELTRRSEAFIKAAKEVGLELVPFERGFFVCVPSKDPVRLMKKLYEYNTYVVVTKSCIRIALCAINEEEASRLPKIILEAKQKLGE